MRFPLPTRVLTGSILCLVLLAGCDLFGANDGSVSLQTEQDTYAVAIDSKQNSNQVQGSLSYALANASLQSVAFSKCGEGAFPPPKLQFKDDGTWTDAYEQFYILIKCPDQEVMPQDTYRGAFELRVPVDDWVPHTVEGTYRMAWTVRVSGNSRSVYSDPFTLTVE
ncbi:MAG: hypothetical protein PPP56_04140 [Longimonas sp.]|uniref:hypothetical protein n=1 Tax=Longimonas sp. TaxID=2039626 RepID=UPI0033518507